MIRAKFCENQSSGLRGDQTFFFFCELKMADGPQHNILMLPTRGNHKITDFSISSMTNKSFLQK